MSTRLLIAAAAAMLASVSASHAQTTITSTYSATDTLTSETGGTGGSKPTINTTGTFLPSPFTSDLTNLSAGQTVGLSGTTPNLTFLEVSPVTGGSGVGTVSGTVSVAFSFNIGGSAVTGVTSTTTGANPVTLSGGNVDIAANYNLFYGTSPQTDCITWDTATCTANGSTTTVGDAIVVTFADNAVLDVTLYNWSDWTMAPYISFKLACAPGSPTCAQSQNGSQTPVPEPTSFALFGTALAGISLIRRRRNGVKFSDTH